MPTSGERSWRTQQRKRASKEVAALESIRKAQKEMPPDLVSFVEKCRESPRYFIPRCLQIIPREGGELVPFVPNVGQDMVLDAVEEQLHAGEPVRVIVLKSRRWGISTLGEALVYWKTSLFANINGIVVAHKKQNTQEIFRIAKTFYDYDSRHQLGIAPEILASNELAIRFDTDRKTKALGRRGLNSHLMLETAEGTGVATGTTLQAAHLSETSKWSNPAIMAGIGIALSKTPGSIGIMESTAEGYDAIFQKAWENAVAGRGGWKPVFLPWHLDPNNWMRLSEREREAWDFSDRSERELYERHSVPLECLKWRRMMLGSPDLIRAGYTPEAVFSQEFPTTPEEAFLTSGKQFFLLDFLKRLETSEKGVHKPAYKATIDHERCLASRPPGSRDAIIVAPTKDDYGELTVWEEPQPGEDYVVAGDVAEGLEHGDNSVAWVLKRSTLKFVARIKTRRADPDEFGTKCGLLAWWYNTALVGIEWNGPGISANGALRRLGYARAWFDRDVTRTDEPMAQRIGWRTTAANRRSILDRLEEEIRQGTISMPAAEFYDEARTFQLVDGRPEAMVGKHDDEIMAAAIAIQLHIRGGATRGAKTQEAAKPAFDPRRPKANASYKQKTVREIAWF